ncbi:unnamed protein product, partial [Laminaria digitata]
MGQEQFAFSGRSYDFQTYVDCKNWINGEFVESSSGEWMNVDNP